jgi:hypothetical protein
MSEQCSGIVITKRMVKELNEEQLARIREHNREHMTYTHQRGSQELPIGIPGGCKVEQPREQREHITTLTYKQGDTQYTNGLLRIRYKNGHEKYEYHIGFAGPARAPGDMNGGEGDTHQWG